MARSKDPPRLARPAGLPPPARHQIEALLESAAPAEQVQQLPSVHLNRLIAEVGLPDAAELLELASAEQVRELIDLQVWQGDRVDAAELLDWGHALAALSADARRRHLRGLDIELIALLLRRHSTIYLVAEDAETPPEEPEGSLHATPDGWFVLDIVESAERAHALTELVDALYDVDPDEARRLLLNARWELQSELEEWSLHWRNARLQDLGFDDPIEALEIYAYLDPASVHADERTADRPVTNDPEPTGHAGLVPLQLPSASFWARATGQLAPEEAERVANALLTMANRTMVADRIAPNDAERGQQSLEQLHWRLSLGLEHLCEGDPQRAPALIAGVALCRIARVGHSLLLDLRRQLLSITRRNLLGRRSGGVDLVDDPLGASLAGIVAPRPQLYDAADGRLRPFRDRQDLQRAAAWIAEADAVCRLVPQRPDPMPQWLTLGDLFRTEVVNRLLDRQGPLDTTALAAFLQQHLPEGHLAPRVIAAAHELARGRCEADEAAGRVVASWLERMEQLLGTLRPDDLDLRFVEGLWLAISPSFPEH